MAAFSDVEQELPRHAHRSGTAQPAEPEMNVMLPETAAGWLELDCDFQRILPPRGSTGESRLERRGVWARFPAPPIVALHSSTDIRAADLYSSPARSGAASTTMEAAFARGYT